MHACVEFPGPLGAMRLCPTSSLVAIIGMAAPILLFAAAGLCIVFLSRFTDSGDGQSVQTTKLVDDRALFQQMLLTTKQDMATCTMYKPNLKALAFGECMCGRPRADHTDAALAAGGEDFSPKKVESEDALRERMTRKETVECTLYRPNLNALNFGECQCGEPRVAHSSAALIAAGEHVTPKKVDEDALRERMTRRDTVACTHYRPNLNALNFGECQCGEPRASHSSAALTAGESPPAKKVDDKALRERMAARSDSIRLSRKPPRPRPTKT